MFLINYCGAANGVDLIDFTRLPLAKGVTYTEGIGSGSITEVKSNTLPLASQVTIESTNGLNLDCNNPQTTLIAWVDGQIVNNVVWTQSVVWKQTGEYFGTANPIYVVNFTNGPVTYGVTYTDENGCSTTDEVVINMSNYAAATNIYQNVSPDFSATYQTSSGSNIINHAWEITAFDINA